MAQENRGQKIAGAAADIDHRVKAGELVCGRNGRRFVAVETDHGLVEVRGFLRVPAEKLKNRHGIGFLHTCIAGFQAVNELLPSSPPPVARQSKNGGSRLVRALVFGGSLLIGWSRPDARPWLGSSPWAHRECPGPCRYPTRGLPCTRRCDRWRHCYHSRCRGRTLRL